MPPRARVRGPAIPTEELGAEEILLRRFPNELPFNVGRQDDSCASCGAFRWKLERRVKDANLFQATYSNCCQQGAVELPLKYFPDDVGEQVPEFYRELLTEADEDSKQFRTLIRKYNNALSFTSLGAKVDRSVAGQLGVYVFRVSGQLSHLIGSLMPLPEDQPGFAQIFIYGGGGEAEANLRIERCRAELDPQILMQFQHFMNENNPYAQVFRSAAAICNEGNTHSIRINTITAAGTDHRRYNRPTANEIAAIVDGDGQIGAQPRDIVLQRQSGDLQRISELHTGYFALRYPLLFLYGSQMWSDAYKHSTDQNVDGDITNLEWFAYLLFQRPAFSVILSAGRLFQEFVVDMYLCVEHSRLQYLRFHQKEIRAALYSGAIEALGNEAADEIVGRRVVLPSTFIGGPRHLRQLYQDAMSLVAEFGNPSLFITMTANPQWPEVLDSLGEGQLPEDRPDIVARVFHMKFRTLLDDVTKRERFGKCPAYVYSVEFQKRGLPHVHLILFLDHESRPRTAEQIDAIISAQLPDQAVDPQLFDLVTQFMLHGPCQDYKCWTGSECKLGYPRPFLETTTFQEDAYPTYKRPNNGRFFDKGMTRYENGSVVPYNRFLLLKYNCHINVEAAISIRAIKYLFKYILKGHDRTMANLQSEDQQVDEIMAYVNARFLSGPEAVWRLLKFPIAGRFPAVQRLSIHLENQQTVYYVDDMGLQMAMESGRAERTTLTEFFRLCVENAPLRGSNATIRSLKYQEITRYFRWNAQTKRLTPRRNDRIAIGRVYFANSKHGDLYYLRLLLSHVCGPTSFNYLRTVDGVLCSTFREAADKLGLLHSDRHYHESLTEAAIWSTGQQLRHMLAIILTHSSPANPLNLWVRHITDLSDDCERQILRMNPDIQLTQPQIENYALYLMEKTLIDMETSLEQVGLRPVEDQLLLQLRLPDEARDGRSNATSPEESQRKHQAMLNVTTNEQRTIIIRILQAINSGEAYMAFLDGPGGTGKTFVLNCVLHYCNSVGVPFLAVSAAGIASLLLLNGRTAHNAFKIPIPVDDDSVCPISSMDALGRQLQSVRFIVWDEVAMQHRHAIECVDRTLKDLTGSNLPFGGKVILFAGDFRQTLPIVKRANLMQQAAASLKASVLWNQVAKFALSVNIRLGGTAARPDPLNVAFGRWLLDLGSGRLQQDYVETVPLVYCNITKLQPPAMFDAEMLDREYRAAGNMIDHRDWGGLTELYSGRCIITPLNATVHAVNETVMQSLPGDTYVSTSIDIMDEAFYDPVTPNILNTFNFSGFPAHRIQLKVGASFMILRNLHLANGLCNGTQVLITDIAPNALQCRILTGDLKGKVISLPKVKLHHDGNEDCPIPFWRYQFPIIAAFCMTINKSQGQSLQRVSVLLPNPVFAHGQLYVALSRCTSAANVHVSIVAESDVLATKNIVFHPVLLN